MNLVSQLYDGFNGATAISPWRTASTPCSVLPSIALQWGHGNFAVENIPVQHRPVRGLRDASMGPRQFRRGEQRDDCNNPRRGKALQWGHGNFAVENWTPQYGHGGISWLQWGHGNFAVEN